MSNSVGAQKQTRIARLAINPLFRCSGLLSAGGVRRGLPERPRQSTSKNYFEKATFSLARIATWGAMPFCGHEPLNGSDLGFGVGFNTIHAPSEGPRSRVTR